jgi:hypothetical protein
MPEPEAEDTLALSATHFSVAMFGFVEFLRPRRVLRIIVAVLGVSVILLSLPSMANVKLAWLPESFRVFGLFTLIFVAPWILWAATVSGPRFRVVLSFEPEKAREERREVEQQFGQSNAPEDALKVDLARLNEYYVMNQTQVRSSFRWAKFAMVVGFLTIIVGIWLFYFRGAQPDKFMAAISTAAGIVVNLVSGLFFYLCFKMQERSASYYAQLANLQKLYVAIRMVDGYHESSERTKARDMVMQELLHPRQISL